MVVSKRWAGSLALVLAAWFVSTSSASAFGQKSAVELSAGEAAEESAEPDDTDDSNPPHRVQSPEEALAEDTAMIAEERGWTVAEAGRQIWLQEVSGPIIGKLRTEFPDSFAEARMAEDPGGVVTVVFAGEVPAGASQIAGPLGDDIKLVGGAALSERAMERRTGAVSQALLELGYRNFTTAGDAVTGLVSSSVQLADGAPRTERDALAALPDALRDHVRLELTVRPVVDELPG